MFELRFSTVVATGALWKTHSCFALTFRGNVREQASRGYEWLVLTLNVQAERSEPRVCFVSRTNSQKSSGMG